MVIDSDSDDEPFPEGKRAKVAKTSGEGKYTTNREGAGPCRPFRMRGRHRLVGRHLVASAAISSSYMPGVDMAGYGHPW